MSDLQCPARFLVLGAPESATAEQLRDERVAAVYDGVPRPGYDGPGDSARALAEALGLRLEALTREVRVEDVVARRPQAIAELRDLADLHRGETVVVLAAGKAGRRVDVALDADGASVVEVSPGAGT